MIFREYRRDPAGLADLLPWGAVVDDGIVITKQGLLVSGWEFEGPDVESSTSIELRSLAMRLNHTLRRLDSGWTLHVDSIRRETRGYDLGVFPTAAGRLVDEERAEQFGGSSIHHHFRTRHVVCLAWRTPAERQQLLKRWLSPSATEKTDWGREFEAFGRFCETFQDGLSSVWKMERLDSESLVAHFQACLSSRKHPVVLPDPPMYLDCVLGGHGDLYTGIRPEVGQSVLRVLTIDGFPRMSSPAILGFLEDLAIPFRWSTRWIALSRFEAERLLQSIRRNWWRGRLGLATELRSQESKSDREHADFERRANVDAVQMWADANEALGEASSGEVAYGYLSNAIVLQGADEDVLDDHVTIIQRACEQHGFIARIETVNAMQAFLGSLPGEAIANRRRPVMHTLNLAHLVPGTSVYVGELSNPSSLFPSGSPPLVWGQTAGSTPFRGHLHVGDVGHTMVVGPTGAGKSVLLNVLGWSWARYPDAQVFMFDKGHSAYATGMAVGGTHYDLLSESGPAFAPLASIDEEDERIFAADWLEATFDAAGFSVKTEDALMISDALANLAGFPRDQRTLTTLKSLLQKRELRTALDSYTVGGAFGQLLDASTDGFEQARFHVFELSRLLEAGERLLGPTLGYLFHAISRRLTGAPTLICIDEAWSFLEHGMFGQQIRRWAKELRKKNAVLVLATQSVEDVSRTGYGQGLFEAMPTRIFLPNVEAATPGGRAAYQSLGLNDRQVDLVAGMTPKQEYYWLSPKGRRVIDLALGPLALAFFGAGDPESVGRVQKLVASSGAGWAQQWLNERGLHEWGSRLAELESKKEVAA